MEPVDTPVDGNGFLHAASFALLHLKDWNTVATIRADVVRFPTNARLNVITDGRTLHEMRGGMSDPAMLGRLRTNWLEQYDSWTKFIIYMKKTGNYADILFVFG